MRTLPSPDQVSLPMVCVLAVSRADQVSDDALEYDDLRAMILDVIELLDVDSDVLTDIEQFDNALDGALDQIVALSWVDEYDDGEAYGANDMTDEALAWVRSRLERSGEEIALLDQIETHLAEALLLSAALSDDGE